MVELNMELLIFFKKVEDKNIQSTSFIKIISLLNTKRQKYCFLTQNREGAERLCFRVCCKKEGVRLGEI